MQRGSEFRFDEDSCASNAAWGRIETYVVCRLIVSRCADEIDIHSRPSRIERQNPPRGTAISFNQGSGMKD